MLSYRQFGTKTGALVCRVEHVAKKMPGKFDLANGTLKSVKQQLYTRFRLDGEPETGYCLIALHAMNKGDIIGLMGGDILTEQEQIARNNYYLMDGQFLTPRVLQMDCAVDGQIYMDCTTKSVCIYLYIYIYNIYQMIDK